MTIGRAMKLGHSVRSLYYHTSDRVGELTMTSQIGLRESFD